MANDLNLCQFIGRFGKDPEIAYSQSGKATAKFSLAVGSQWKDKTTGQKQEATEWVRVVAFDRLAEIIGEYCKKGSKVYLSGKIQTRKWQDQSGQDRYSTEIIANELQMLDLIGDKPQQPSTNLGDSAGREIAARSGEINTTPTPPIDDFEDDIPF